MSPHLLAMEARLRIHQCQRQSTNHRAAEWYRRTPERRLQLALIPKCPCYLLNLNASQDRTGPGQSPRHRTGGVRFAGHALDSKGCERKTRHNGCSSLATLRLGYDRSRGTLNEKYVGRGRGLSVGDNLQTRHLPQPSCDSTLRARWQVPSSPLLCFFTDAADSRRYFG